LRRQQQNLDKLRAENENLKTDVATLQARTTMKPLNSFEQSQLDKVTIEIERYSHLVDIEKSKISTNEEQISKLRQQIWNQRRNMGGTNAVAESHRNVEKQVRILENRLDQGIVKFNRILANNKKLREDIDNLRGERISFEGVYKKLEKVRQHGRCVSSLYLLSLMQCTLHRFRGSKIGNVKWPRLLNSQIQPMNNAIRHEWKLHR